MLVRFHKASNRHYGVIVERRRAPAVKVEPAPGYDAYLPHDLLHFVAEAGWELDGAVFGQLAAGGDPGLFLPVDEALVGRWVRRRKLRPTWHGPDGARSESLAGVLHAGWRARTGRAPLPEYWERMLRAADAELEELERAFGLLDDLAARWHGLPVGSSLTLEWPRPERRRPHRARERRRPVRAR
jgi:hypothetical protein